MLDTIELRLLSQWCRTRRMQWQPGLADDGRPAVLLLGAPRFDSQSPACRSMMLLPDHDEWRLLDGPGQVLAAASGLSELLDALDAGVGEIATPGRGATGHRDAEHWDTGHLDIDHGDLEHWAAGPDHDAADRRLPQRA